MKLTFQKAALLNGINIVLKAVPSKTTMPILECILIDASTDVIKLTGNDMELGIETKVEGNILEKRSEERRVGKECASMCRSRWSPYH